MSNPLPLNGEKLTNHLIRALAGSGGQREGLKVAQEPPSDDGHEYLRERPANLVRQALQDQGLPS